MKIVLITTGQPSCNPRIVKEADCLSNAGYDVTVVYSFFIDWAQENDELLLKNALWKYKMVGGDGAENKLLFFFTRLRFKVNQVLYKYVGNKFLFAERAQARAYDELLRAAKKIKADWYIGHNLGALPIAVQAAKYNNAKSGFDFEDYHRAEVDSVNKSLFNRIVFLENKYIPFLKYISVSSDLILEEVRKDHLNFKYNFICLYNSFPLKQLPKVTRVKHDKESKLNLFWFSQTIGLSRGLEIVLEALKLINDKNIHLTLAGRFDDSFKNYLKHNAISLKKNIHLAGIISSHHLPSFSSNFDIGLAVELPNPYNRDICLTNKIFTYLLAGNAIIFSATNAQEKFNSEYKAGFVYQQENISDLANCILLFKDNILLENQKRHNRELAETIFNWELESKKLLQLLIS